MLHGKRIESVGEPSLPRRPFPPLAFLPSLPSPLVRSRGGKGWGGIGGGAIPLVTVRSARQRGGEGVGRDGGGDRTFLF